MPRLTGKNMVVIGGSRGVGRRIVEAAIRNGARVLAVARQEGPLRQLAQVVSGTEVLSLDATDEGAPSKVFDGEQFPLLLQFFDPTGTRRRPQRRACSNADDRQPVPGPAHCDNPVRSSTKRIANGWPTITAAKPSLKLIGVQRLSAALMALT
jgi:hypothetical protein